MVTVLELEKAAARLRCELKAVTVPEIRLLCGLRFGGVLLGAAPEHREAYLRELLPQFAEAAARCDRREFLPDEMQSLRQLVSQLQNDVELKGSKEVEAFACLVRQGTREDGEIGSQPMSDDGRAVRVNGLFVEYYPDLDLAPRGRLLDLRVVAMALPGGAKDDDVVVRNPVSDPDDRFLAQARDSVAASRRHLAKRYGWNGKKRYRFDFTVESAGARFTGDSLGVAFAVGAVAALGRIESLRDEIGVNPTVAFCGAMAAHGVLAPVDLDALKLKVYRGFWSDLKVLVIPRVHLLEAWSYLKELEEAYPGRRLELMGADTLDDVAGDPRLVPTRRLSVPAYAIRWMFKSERRVTVQAPLLLLLLYLLVCVAHPKAQFWFDWNPAHMRILSSGFDVLNADQVFLWRITFNSEFDTAACGRCVGDLDGDGTAEVIFVPFGSQEKLPEQNTVHVYSPKGWWAFRSLKHLFSDTCTVANQYPGEDVSVRFQPEAKLVDTGGGVILITLCFRSEPARNHIRMWSSKGDRIGWYIHSGAAGLQCAFDHDGNGARELLFAGVNNRTDPRAASFFVLPPSGAHGVSPPYENGPDFDLSWVDRGNQLIYMQFPPTDMARSSSQPYNSVSAFQVEGASVLRLDTKELGEKLDWGLRYFIRRTFRLSHVTADDWYKALRGPGNPNKGLAPVTNWEEYLAARSESVRYWSDSGWVTERQLQSATDPHR